MAHDFSGKVALVTGGASGIGAAAARHFAAAGARVMIGDIQQELGQSVAKEIGDAASFQPVDVTELSQVESLTNAAVEAFGRLDFVFNNAGIGSFGETPDLDPEQWRRVIDVDLHSVFYGCRAAIPHLRAAGGGAIVNTASISGLGADYGFSAYNAAKGAVVNYTRTLAIDHGKEGIRVNAVCPGPIDTPLASILVDNDQIRAMYDAAIPLGRVGVADEVASVVMFLCSEDARYVTGQALAIDGGITAHTGQPNFTRVFREILGAGN
ncbi:MAG: SDR family oxidoreductase [Myxococcales bacterium]|nr:SDR family oxidoreductase [Myxococcales bacterium]